MPDSTRDAVVRPIPNSYVVPGFRLIGGEYPGARDASLARRRLERILRAGVGAFIDLTAPIDPLEPYHPLLRELSAEAAYTRLPVPDMGVPRVPRMRQILDAVDAALSAERTVYLHCWGGVGRTGTAIGCWLVRQGHDPDAALEQVARLFATMSPEKCRAHPEGSPQTEAQRQFVRDWIGK